MTRFNWPDPTAQISLGYWGKLRTVDITTASGLGGRLPEEIGQLKDAGELPADVKVWPLLSRASKDQTIGARVLLVTEGGIPGDLHLRDVADKVADGIAGFIIGVDPHMAPLAERPLPPSSTEDAA